MHAVNYEADFTYDQKFLDPRRTPTRNLRATEQQPKKSSDPMAGWVAFKQRQAATSDAGPIGEARFVGLHYPYTRFTRSTAGVPDVEAEVWLCVCGLVIPAASVETDFSKLRPGESVDEVAFYSQPGHRNCTTRTLSRPGTTAQVFLASRQNGDDHVIHVWCIACGDVHATPMTVASSPRRFYFPSFTLETTILSVSTARDVVIEHEETCPSLPRYVEPPLFADVADSGNVRPSHPMSIMA